MLVSGLVASVALLAISLFNTLQYFAYFWTALALASAFLLEGRLLLVTKSSADLEQRGLAEGA
jgi:hypothetical protein